MDYQPLFDTLNSFPELKTLKLDIHLSYIEMLADFGGYLHKLSSIETLIIDIPRCEEELAEYTLKEQFIDLLQLSRKGSLKTIIFCPRNNQCLAVLNRIDFQKYPYQMKISKEILCE